MDRFIAPGEIHHVDRVGNLKSNMDRFIAERKRNYIISHLFKIQYG